MKNLTRDDLYTLEAYAEIRPEFRAQVMAHKKNRQVSIGNHATIYFEDRLVVQYQIQEMLRIEKIFESAGIQEELDAYNPMIPNGSNWKATFMIEYADPEERKQALEKMIGIEDRVWVKVAGFEAVFAIADEDLERENEEKTSSVHFLRFELSEDMKSALKNGASLSMGIDHPAYLQSVDEIPVAIRESLVADLD